MASIVELAKSRAEETSVDKASNTRTYLVSINWASETEADVRSLVLSTAPLLSNLLNRKTVKITPDGGGLFTAEVTYDAKDEQKDGESTFSVDTTGGQEKIQYGRATRHSYTLAGGEDGGDAPDFQGGINVTQHGVEGIEIKVPKFVLTVTKTYSLAYLVANPDIIATWNRLTAKTNLGTYSLTVKGVTFTFLEGDLLFDGVRLNSKQKGDSFEAVFRFEASKGVDATADPTDTIPIGNSGITVLHKQGWEYLWVKSQEGVDATTQTFVSRPQAAYIVQVYLRADFAALGV